MVGIVGWSLGGYYAPRVAAVGVNEAFASVAVHSTRLLGVDASLVNAHGGAIALGHPIGADCDRFAGIARSPPGARRPR